MQFELYESVFKCKKCGECCKGYGGTVVTRKNIQAIAEFINVDEKHFIDKYCQISGKKFVLAQNKNGYCVFWNKLCTIHPVKPKMCKAWPFIKSVLMDIGNWKIMGSMCPGIETKAPEHVVRAWVEKELKKNNDY